MVDSISDPVEEICPGHSHWRRSGRSLGPLQNSDSSDGVDIEISHSITVRGSQLVVGDSQELDCKCYRLQKGKVN